MPRLTRVGFDATVLAPATRYTGVGEYALRLLRHLGAETDRVSIVAYGAPGSGAPPELPASIKWRPLPRLPLGKLAPIFTSYAVLRRLAREDALDLFHAPTVHTRPALLPVPRRLGCPLVVTVHDVIPLTYYDAAGEPLPWRLRQFYRWNLRAALNAQHVITVSETSRREIISIAGPAPPAITSIYNGGSPGADVGDAGEALQRLGVTRPFILYVGSCEPRKNLPRLLSAYELAVREGLEHDLVLVTSPEPPHGPPIRALSEETNLRQRVRFLDHLADSDLDALYQSAAVFAFPSLHEGFGLPPLYAMQRGTPVVASRAGSLEEVLGDAAEYVDPLSPPAIARGLLNVACNPARRAQLIEAGGRRAVQFSWRETARQTIDVYERVARETGRCPHEDSRAGRRHAT